MSPKKIAVIITESLQTSIRSIGGLRYSVHSAMTGYDISVILFGPSVISAKKELPPVSNEDEDEAQIMLEQINDQGGRIYACKTYCDSVHISQQDLLRFIEIQDLRQIAEIINTAEIQLSF